MRTLLFVCVTGLLLAGSASAQWEYVELFNNGIPDGWTGPLWSWVENGDVFDSPYITTLAAENNALYSAPIDITGADFLVMQAHYHIRCGDGAASGRYAFDPDGPWISFFGVDAAWSVIEGVADLTLTQDEILGDQLYFRFSCSLSPDGPVYEFALDDLRVSSNFSGWLYVDSELTSSYWIPGNGGTIEWDATVTNTFPFSPPGLQYWVYVQVPLPSSIFGPSIGPFQATPLTVPANGSIALTDLAINIPGFGPDGRYHVYTYVGLPFSQAYHTMDMVTVHKQN